jgi:hypothetical protein
MRREFDRKIKKLADTANTDFTAEVAATFLDTIPGGTVAPIA